MFSCGLNRKIVYSKFFGIFTSADNNDWYQISWSSNTYGVDNTCSPSQSIIYLDNSPYLKNCVIYKTFILEPHYKVYLQFQFWRIDLWNNNLFTTYADLKIKYQQSFSNLDTITNFCYDSENDEVKNIILSFSHNTPTLMIIFKGDGSRWGISNIQLEIDECSIGCDSCSQSQCFDQKLVPILIDWTTIEIPPLFQSCGGYQFQFTYGNFMQIEIDLDPHNIINLTIKFQIGNADNPTLTVKIDNQLVTTTQQFSDRVSDALFFCHQNQILEMNIVDYDHTNPTIKFRIDAIMIQYDPMSGMPYFGISDFQLFVKTKIKQKDSDLGMPFEGCLLSKPELVEGCTFCVRNICLFCDEGWIYIEQDQKCSPICGDLKLVQNEECDDSNLNPYDGCHNCKYSCPQFCLQCLKGKCRECQFPRILINGLCHLECDQVLTNSVQQKYLGCGFEYLQINGYYQHTLLNNKDNQQFLLYEFLDCNPQSYGIMGYYYNQCNIQYIEQCKKQQWNICLECEDHYQLSFNKQYCVSKCNDEYIEDFEVCDDNNNIQFDSCYKCQPSCQLECLNCVYGKCLYCREGWYLIDQQCQSICGDGIVVPFEQCDDGNLDIGDGCFQCQTECFYCEICNYKNQCQICQEHFHLVQDICLPICGDNYVELGLEECDDGNEVQMHFWLSNMQCWVMFRCMLNWGIKYQWPMYQSKQQ
ncbi:unnamed protein product [Paramecium sonneborni]|uniref:Uncharacterized protein n=1 Tax=Paramecium sonneborni TaxID=65129 RepID=A0A8S1M486_9CILI|nr:unnamed protein product [Paramecium sonneborni]